MKILIIEDDETIRQGLKFYLEQENFNIIDTDCAKKAIELIENNMDLNMILLDINLPDKNGFDLFQEIKNIKDVPIIFLTANDLEVSVVRGLDMGADDYLSKPFGVMELVSRVKALLRRTMADTEEKFFRLGDIFMDGERRTAFVKDVPVELSLEQVSVLN